MKPTKTHGICGHCREMNPYTRINCVRCEARLAWAFLIDGKDDKDFETPFARIAGRLLSKIEPQSNPHVPCRFCEAIIDYDAKICSHCGNWQAVAKVTRFAWALVHPEAPEIQRLLQNSGEKS